MAANDDEIEHAVVGVSPDLTGFTKDLKAKLKAATAGVSAKVKLVADGAGFNTSVRTVLRAQAANAPTYKVKLVADATGFNLSVKQTLAGYAASHETPTYKVKLVADGTGLNSSIAGATGNSRSTRVKVGVDPELDEAKLDREAKKAEKILYSRIREPVEKFEQAEQSAHVAAIYRLVNSYEDMLTKAHLQAYETDRRVMAQKYDEAAAEDKKRWDESAEGQAAAAKKATEAAARKQKKLTAAAQRESDKRAKAAEAEAKAIERAAQQAAAKRKAAFNSMGDSQIIDFGGKGVRPMNLLYAAVAAMTPALFAMAASAVQASTSVAALGAAGVGAALGIGGLVIAFKGLTDLWALRKTAQAEADTDAANSAQTAVANAQAQLQANNSLLDSQQSLISAEKDLHDARVDAKNDLIDLKQKVADLQNQQKADTLSLAEKEAARQKVYANYFSSALDRARADQDVADAKTSLSDTKTDLAQATPELADAVKKGVENSDKVNDAKEKLRQAREREAEAKLAKANQDLGGSAGAASSAQAQLNAKLADASPALRDLYNWLDKNQGMFDALQRQIQQHFLPGFTDFLEITTTPPGKGQKSTFQFFADQASDLGDILSDQVRDFAKFTNSPLFRSSFTKISENNGKAFQILGDAMEILSKPLLRILEKASPLLPKMATGLEDFAKWLDRVIEKADRNGSLAKWFDDAGKSAGKWLDIGKNIFVLLGNIFKGALPAGGSLVDRFDEFTKTLADWSGSTRGQQQIKDFFGFFKDLPYGQIGQFLTGLTAAFLTWNGMRFLWAAPMHLFFTALTTWAAQHPEQAAQAMQDISAAIGLVIGQIADHPDVAATLLAILGAAKLGKAIGFNIKIPGVEAIKTALTSKFKILENAFGGASSTGTMTVRAAVVNVYGTSATPGTVATPGKSGGVSSLPVLFNGLTAAAVLAYLFGGQGFGNSKNNGGVFQDLDALIKTPSWTNLLKSMELASPVYWFTYGIGELKKNGLLATFFGGMVPNLLSGGKANTWAQFGQLFRDTFSSVASNIPPGLMAGIAAGAGALWSSMTAWVGRFVDWVKQLFGIKSPSTVFAAIGGMLVDGLWKGFTDRWTGLLTTVTGWIGTNITAPLSAAFLGAGVAIRSAFTGAFDTLSSKLSAPVKAAFGWLDKYMLTPLNAILNGLGITPITLLSSSMPSSTATDAATTVGSTVGSVVGDIGAIISKADGGPIPGYSPNSRADNIPAMLTADEYVQPVAAVKHYGTDFMEAVRTRQFPRFADGGLVAGLIGSQGKNLATNVISGALKGLSLKDMVAKIVSNAASAVFGSADDDYTASAGGTYIGSLDLARVGENTARAMGATDKQLVALMETGIVESTMRNLAYGDRDSVGWLQQRPSQGWGTVAQIMDPAYATRKFINAAKAVNSAGMTAGQLAQAVQRSAYPDRYDKQEANAVAILNRETPFLTGYTGPDTTVTTGAASKASLVAFGKWLQARGYTVSENPAFGGVTPGGHADGSKHYLGRAIDVNHGAGTSTLEQSYLAKIIPEAHRRGFHTIFMTTGHYNHAHIDFNKGGPVPDKLAAGGQVTARKYDSGGTLPPGYTLAFNGTGRNETIRTAKQEQQLSTAMRLDRRDIALLASHIAAASSPSVHMDGRKVAEITNSYSYMPAGV